MPSQLTSKRPLKLQVNAANDAKTWAKEMMVNFVYHEKYNNNL